jgi:two-component system phosphate regulon sensor histidine kinase PhoR
MILEHSYGQIPIELNMPITRAHKSAVRLTNLVNELLRISRIEQGDLAYDITPIDTVHLVREVVDEFSQKAASKNLHLSIEIEPTETPHLALADEQKLREVLHNIVDNAINYTPQGKVTISVKNSPENTQLVEVSDTGIGIAHEDIRLLFGKFQRGERGARQFTDGSGLGLYISKKLISGMHGKIHIDSPGPGKGAVFTIELPKEGYMPIIRPEFPAQREFLGD